MKVDHQVLEFVHWIFYFGISTAVKTTNLKQMYD